MISEKPIPSTFAGLCCNHSGTLVNDHRSFTKIMKNMVRALKISMETILFEVKFKFDMMFLLVFLKNKKIEAVYLKYLLSNGKF